MRYLLLFLFVLSTLVIRAQSQRDTLLLQSSIPESISSLELRIAELETALEMRNSRFQKFQLGFSFGFNGFVNGPKSYYIRKDSTLGQYGNSRGVSGMISALLGYSIKPKHTLYINIPLSDLSPNENATLGVFNRRIAGGLGYGFNMGALAIITVVNIYPYEEPAIELLDEKKYEQEPLSAAELDAVPMVSRVSPSLTIGVCYHLSRSQEMLGFFE